MILRTTIALTTALALLLIAPPVNAENPYTMADGTWISLIGQVRSVGPDVFELDYGSGQVTVEMDDGDRDADAYVLDEGDAVTVTGLIDDDFFEATKIEAGSVYVKKLDTTFFASARDEEEVYPRSHTTLVEDGVLIQGTVTEVHDDEFVVDTGARRIIVDTAEMNRDPLDDEGYQKIQVGDMVSVTGNFERDLFEGRELMASTVTTLVENFDASASR